MSTETPTRSPSTPAPRRSSASPSRSTALAMGLLVATVVVAAAVTYVALPTSGSHSTVTSAPPPQVQTRCLKNGQPCSTAGAPSVASLGDG